MPPANLVTPAMAVATLAGCMAFVQALGLFRLAEAKRGRLASIDGLRGFLAIAAFLHHLYNTYRYKMTGERAPPSSACNLFGTAGVTLFFTITGFSFFGEIGAQSLAAP